MAHLDEAKKVINDEINGILEVEKALDKSFNMMIEAILASTGRVVMCGMGKSGHIAKKIFATLVSTGTPSMFMHPAEAFHGDLGMIQPEDIFFAISNSGETEEVTKLLPFIKGNKNLLISMTGAADSTIARASDFHINISIEREACPLNLAPTTSTTASLVLGDAISVALMKAKNFGPENFARYHPGGSLGRKLLCSVGDVFLKANYVSETDSLLDILGVMASSPSGAVLVGNPDKLLGIITDGDIRKRIANFKNLDVMKVNAKYLMTEKPKTILSKVKCGDADYKMKQDGVNSLVVIDGERVIGIYDNLNRK